mmetsp:Transcript_6973/g.19734  ORF Transcript_6973/g.19734 Transcript_6973/m.19734 type:complete len:201 (+) Transcript_6973:781-1383(+)
MDENGLVHKALCDRPEQSLPHDLQHAQLVDPGVRPHPASVRARLGRGVHWGALRELLGDADLLDVRHRYQLSHRVLPRRRVGQGPPHDPQILLPHLVLARRMRRGLRLDQRHLGQDGRRPVVEQQPQLEDAALHEARSRFADYGHDADAPGRADPGRTRGPLSHGRLPAGLPHVQPLHGHLVGGPHARMHLVRRWQGCPH